MIQLKPANSDQDYCTILEIAYCQKTDFLEPIQDLIQLTQEQFGEYLRSHGTACLVLRDHEIVGMCWITLCKGEAVHRAPQLEASTRFALLAEP